MEPLFRGESETDELHKIFKLLGTFINAAIFCKMIYFVHEII